MCFCSLFCAHQSPPTFQLSHFQPVQKHGNAFPWKQFWGVPVPLVLCAAHSPMALADCTCQCVFLRAAHAWKYSQSVNLFWQLAAGTRKAEGLQWYPWMQTCCSSLGREESSSQLPYDPGKKFAHSEPVVQRVSVSGMITPGSSDGWEQDASSAMPWILIPPCCTEDHRCQTTMLPAYFLMILHFHTSSNTG